MSRQLIHKDQSKVNNALCVVSHVNTVNTRDQSTSCFNGSNAMLCRYSWYKMHTHVHMFLPITFLIFNGFSIQKKFWLSNHTIKSYMSIVLTVSTLPVHYCIEILRLVSTVSTYIEFGVVGKPWFSAFQNFFRIEKRLNIKKVMGRNMCTCVCILYQLYRHNIAFEPLKHDVLWSLVSTVSTWDTTHNALFTLVWSLCVNCLDKHLLPFNVHMCDKVTMSMNQWLPCYLIRTGTMCNSKK